MKRILLSTLVICSLNAGSGGSKGAPDRIPPLATAPAVEKTPMPPAPARSSMPQAPAALKMPTPPAPFSAAPSSSMGVANSAQSQETSQAIVEIQKRVLMGLQQIDAAELSNAVQEAINASLISKEFEKGVNHLGKAVNDLADLVASNIRLTKANNEQLKVVLYDAATAFDELVRSGKMNSAPTDIFVAQLIKNAINGLNSGFKKARIAYAAPAMPTAPAPVAMPAAPAAASPAPIVSLAPGSYKPAKTKK